MMQDNAAVDPASGVAACWLERSKELVALLTLLPLVALISV